MVSDILDSFAKTMRSAIACMEDVQKWLGSKRELLSPKYEDTAQKLKIITADFDLVVGNVFLRDNVVQQLTKLRTTGFEGFVGQTDAAYTERLDTTKALIGPYRAVADALQPIYSLQSSMMNQAQLKKIPLRYDELKSNIAKEKQSIGELKVLLDSVLDFAVGK